MPRRKTGSRHTHPSAKAPPETAPLASEPDAPGPRAPEGGAVDRAPSAAEATPVAEVSEEVQRLTAELDDARDAHLRLAADFDNYRKRIAREQAELRTRAQAALVETVLEALDDLGRVADLAPEQTSTWDVIAGVELVERKLMRVLESGGLMRVGVEGERFDPNAHEAVGTAQAGSPEADGTVAAVLQPGYRFGPQLLRPARVRVFVSRDDGDASDGDGA